MSWRSTLSGRQINLSAVYVETDRAEGLSLHFAFDCGFELVWDLIFILGLHKVVGLSAACLEDEGYYGSYRRSTGATFSFTTLFLPESLTEINNGLVP